MKTILIITLISLGQLATAQPQVPTIYYVGNMGVAIVKSDSVILIDALHDYYDVYYLPSDPVILKMLQERKVPFKNLIVIAATHLHNDHFDDSLIVKMSQEVPESKVVMGKQPAEKLTGVERNAIRIVDQVGTVKISNQLSLTLKNIGHSGALHTSIENYRIEISWGKQRFVHFGDATPSAKSFDGLTPGADVAVVPYWFCYDPDDLKLLEAQKFKAVIAAHIDPRGADAFGKSGIQVIPFEKHGQSLLLK